MDAVYLISLSEHHFQTKNADFFKNYVTEDFNEYLKRKRTVSAHGNHVEMQAISELYNRPVEVYQYSIGMKLFTARCTTNPSVDNPRKHGFSTCFAAQNKN